MPEEIIRTIKIENLSSPILTAQVLNKSGSGADHSDLLNLSADDHPQYLNIERGDIRYYQKSEVDTAIADAIVGGDGHVDDFNNPHQVTLDQLPEVDISTTAPLEGQTLVWDITSSPGKFVPGTVSVVGSLTDLSDVGSITYTEGHVLRINGSNEFVSAQLNPSDLSQEGATTNQILEWNGSNWAPTTLTNFTNDEIWDAKGDLIVGTGPNASSILTAGVDTYVLTTDSNEPTGLKWVPASTGNINDGDILATGFTFPSNGLKIQDGVDTNQILSIGYSGAASSTLTVDTGDTNRTLTLTGDATVSGTNTGDQTISLTGDVTATGGTGALSTTIADDAVTYTKIQNVVGNNVLLGNNAGANSSVSELSAADVRTILGVEQGAQPTNSTTVEAAGAVMESDTSTANMSFVIDEDTMVSDTDTKVPTQQSVKAYVDNAVTGLLDYKGGYDPNTDSLENSPGFNTIKGDAYTITAQGDFLGVQVEVGDMIIAEVNSAGTDVNNWTVVSKQLDLATESIPGLVTLAPDGSTDGTLVITGDDSRLTAASTSLQDGDTLLTGLEFPSAGLKIQDAGSPTHTLSLSHEGGADSTLTIDTGDTNRLLTLTGDATISGTTSGINSGDITLTNIPSPAVSFLTLDGQELTVDLVDLVNDIKGVLPSANIGTHTHDSGDITDFDTAVSNNSTVLTNSGKISATEANVISALNGATLTDIGTPAGDDRVLIQDFSDTNNLKYVNASELLSGGGDVATDSIWTTKGDLAVGTGASTAQILPVGAGTQNYVLTVDSNETTGLKWAPAPGGAASVTVSDTPPASPSSGDLWFNSSIGTMYIYYFDGSSSQWVTTTSAVGAEQLSDLTDVIDSTPTDKNFLIADGADWTSRALVAADINSVGVTDNYVLTSVGNVTQWLPAQGGGSGMITGISLDNGANVNVAPRSVLNFIQGSNISITIDDDPAGDEVDITISSTGGGGLTASPTPTDNQVAVWTSGTNLEGTAGLTFDGTDLNVNGNITLTGTVDGVDIAARDHNAVTLTSVPSPPVSFLTLDEGNQILTVDEVNLASDVTGILPEANIGSHSHVSGDITDFDTAVDGRISANAVQDGDTLTTGLTFPTSGLKLRDTNDTHNLIVSAGSDLTADHTLTINTGDQDRTLNIQDVEDNTASRHAPTTLVNVPSPPVSFLTLSGQELTVDEIDLTTDVQGILPVTNGGTGASDAATARANLAAQQQQDILDDIGALSPPVGENEVLVSIGPGTFALESGNVLRTSLGLGLGDNPQFTNLTLSGDLTVNGTTTTVNSTTVTLDDPIITLGGDIAPIADDNKDRGVEFRWYDGAAKVGFFGFDDSSQKFTFIPDATNISEVFSGTVGDAAFGNLDLTGNITLTGTVDGVDIAARDHDAISLVNIPSPTVSFLTLSGQELTVDEVDLTADVKGVLPEANIGSHNHTSVDITDFASATDTRINTFIIDEDTMLSDTDTKVPTQQSVKAYVDTEIGAAVTGLLDYKGGYDPITDTLESSPSGVLKGDAYTITAQGDFLGITVEVGDMIIAEVDGAGPDINDWTIVSKQIDLATESSPGIVELATDGQSDANVVVQGNDSRLSDARTPTSHASTHQHGGTDEIATATPGANAIPKATGTGVLADGWISESSVISALSNTSTLTQLTDIQANDRVLIQDLNVSAGLKYVNASELLGGSGSVATDIIWDNKGDLAVGTGSDTAEKLSADGVPDNYVLTTDSAETTGLKWALPSGGLSDGDTLTLGFEFPATTLKIQDAGSPIHSLSLSYEGGADSTLTVDTGDTNRILTLTGDATISGTTSGINSGDITLTNIPSPAVSFLTLSGQELTVDQVDLAADVQGTLPVANGGTGASDAATARTNLGLGTISTQDSDNVNITGGTISGLSSLSVTGNLTVLGTTTTINSTELTVDDKNIELGSVDVPTDITADGGGITLKGSTDKTFNWVDATDSWTSSENLDLASGKSFKIAGADVLTSTTLGSSVTTSSLTTVGTISTGTWAATDIAVEHGGTGASDAATARTNLGVAIGTNVQAQNDLLQDIADIGATSTGDNQFIVSTGVGTFALEDAATARASLGVDEPGTDNSTPVTLTNVPSPPVSFLTLSGQELTVDEVDLTADVKGILPVANGGTGATTILGAQQALNLEPGVDVQTFNEYLADISAITSPTEGDLIRWDGTDWVKYADSNFATAGQGSLASTALQDGDILSTGLEFPATGLKIQDAGSPAYRLTLSHEGSADSTLTIDTGDTNRILTFTGDATVSGTNTGDQNASQVSFNNATSGLTGADVQAIIDDLDANVDDLITLTGIAENITNLGTFTGTTITDNVTIKTALQELETAVEGVGGGSSTLADLSSASDDATKSKYTLTNTIPVEFASSEGNTILYLDETNERIGIGTNAPSTDLHISGGFRLENGTQAPNYVLTSDAAGLATWQPAAGGINDGDTLSTGLEFPATGLKIQDAGSPDHVLTLSHEGSADSTLTLDTGDTNRTLTLSGDATVSGTNTGDQDATQVSYSGTLTSADVANALDELAATALGPTEETSIYIDAGAFLSWPNEAGASDSSNDAGTNNSIDWWNVAVNEKLFTKLAMPPQWDRGNVAVEVFWTVQGTTPEGLAVAWSAAAEAAGNDDPWDTAFSSPVTSADDLVSVNGDIHVINIPNVTIGGSPADGDLLFLKIERVAPVGTTLPEDARLLGVRIKYFNTKIQSWDINKMGDEASDASGVGEKMAWVAPADGYIHAVHSGCSSSIAAGDLTADVLLDAVSILSTKGVIAIGTDSTEAVGSTPHVLTTASTPFTKGQRISFEISSFGGTGGKGLHTDLLISWS